MRQINKLRVTALLLLSITDLRAGAQTPTAAPSPDTSKESSILQSLHTVLRFENDGTGTRETTGQVRLQSEAGVQQFGLLTFGYSGASEQIDIGYVRVRKTDGTVIATPADDIQDMAAEITRQAPMYSDYREKHVAVKGLGVGDVLEYNVKTQVRTPLVPGQFWFDYTFTKDGIVLDEQLELNLPKDHFVNVKSTEVKPAIKDEGSRRIYLWKSANTERKPADEEPPAEIPPPPVQISTFRSWEEVGRWWGALEQERVAPTPEIRAKAAELTKDAKTDSDKLNAIYHYVATRFRYISISFGVGRYQPHAAGEVLNNAYGDCKDKHTLLASLLEAAGIAAYPALINASRNIDPDVPSPGQFNHVITAVPEGKELVWLDTTTEVAPFGWLVPVLRDKQALVVPATKPAALLKTPADSPIKNVLLFEVDGKLDQAGTLDAHVQRSDRGDSEVVLRAAFRQVPQPNWKDLVQRISYASGFSGEVSDVTASNPEATGEPFRFSYKYNRKEYSDWADRKISPPLQLCSLTELKDSKKKPVEPLKFGGPGEYVCKSKIELPKGYTPHLLPAADIVRDFAEYHSSYTFKDGVFEAERRLELKVRELPASRRDDYNSLAKAASDDGNLYTEFSVPTEDIIARAEQMSADELNSAAVKLIDGNNNFSVARDLLLKATAKDPKHKWAWNNLGRAYMSLGSPIEAEKALKKQIEINPKDEYAYKNLGWALSQMEKWDEAAQAYEKSAEVNSDKPDAFTQTQWGHALMKAGKTDEARKQLKRALEIDSGPMILNNVAWELADATVELDEAEAEAKSAVDKYAQSLADLPSLDIPPEYRQRLYTLGTFLDTLGWVYFKKGKLEAAEPYLISAHELSTTSPVAEHVALLRARQDNFEEALRYYAYSQMESGWTGHADRSLEEYLTKKSGGQTELMTRIVSVKQISANRHLLRPAGDSFSWPENSAETKPSIVEIEVAVDGSGAVADARVLNGEEPYRRSAMGDVRKLQLPVITWPGHDLQTVRTLDFVYLPPSMKSSEKRVKVWWSLGKPPAGNVSMVSPDGGHLISIPANMLPGAETQTSTDAANESNAPDALHGASGHSVVLQQGLTLLLMQNLDGAIEKFRQAIQAEPKCASCHRVLANALLQKGGRAAAIDEYKEVVRIEPGNPDDHFMLGAQFEAQGATQAYTGYHFDPKSHTNRPGSPTLPKAARADYESALEQYRLAHQLAPENRNYKEAFERLDHQLNHR